MDTYCCFEELLCLLFKRTALRSYIEPEWLESVLPLCWSFLVPATGLHARLCQKLSWSLWSCGTDCAGVVGASLWCLLKICSTVSLTGNKLLILIQQSSEHYLLMQKLWWTVYTCMCLWNWTESCSSHIFLWLLLFACRTLDMCLCSCIPSARHSCDSTWISWIF